MLQIYNPAYELTNIKKLKNITLSQILTECKRIKEARDERVKRESRKRIEDLKEAFYLDFLNLNLDNAKIAGSEKSTLKVALLK